MSSEFAEKHTECRMKETEFADKAVRVESFLPERNKEKLEISTPLLKNSVNVKKM